MSSPSTTTTDQPTPVSYRPASQTAQQNASIVEVDGVQVDLKNRHFAALLGLLLPGLGHYYQGRKHKALLFGACILSLFFIGLWIGGGRVVYMSFNNNDFRLQFPAQMCVGLPTLPAILHSNSEHPKAVNFPHKGATTQDPRQLTWANFMAPPEDTVELSQWHFKYSAGFELGTLMTAIAGLLNLLAVFDAFAGPITSPNATKKEEE